MPYSSAFDGDTASSNTGATAENPVGLYLASPLDGKYNFCCGVVFLLHPIQGDDAWSAQPIHAFSGGSDGAFPQPGLVTDSSGNLYGTTSRGGASGCGTIFELSPPSGPDRGWSERVLYTFAGGKDGNNPAAGLIGDRNGNLYGTTAFGGEYGFGTVFKLSRPSTPGGSWTGTVLYSFTGWNDGGNPVAALIADRKGNLFGTTHGGGAFGFGTVFELSPASGESWKETVLHAFAGGNDGASPDGGLVVGGRGNFFGTTYEGGPSGGGTVYRVSPPGGTGGVWAETILYTFGGGKEGGSPSGSLILDKKGRLFGMTAFGGALDYGTVFLMSPPAHGSGPWTQKILHSFTGGSDGGGPTGGLVADKSGSLSGTTALGGTMHQGTVFRIIPPSGSKRAWKPTVLLSFNNHPDIAGADFDTAPEGKAGFRGAAGKTRHIDIMYDPKAVPDLLPASITDRDWMETVLYTFNRRNPYGHYAFIIIDRRGRAHMTRIEAGGFGTKHKP
jgi:uncharacterized repeat protein (TIGR03803 family)